MDFEINFAKEPKVIPPDPEVAPSSAEQEAYISLAKDVYKDTAPSIGQVLTEKGSGSAFFVEDDALITDAHVVQDAQIHRVRTTDGKVYPARIEKLDDVNDIAYLRIYGAEKGKYPSLDLESTAPQSSDAFALGHPYGRLNVHISAGRIDSKGTQLDYNCSTRSQKFLDEYRKDINEMGEMIEEMSRYFGRETEVEEIEPCDVQWKNKVENLPPSLIEDGRSWLNRPSLQGLVEVHPGNSGGPLVNQEGSVIGVSRMIESIDPASSNFTPVDVVNDFINEPEQKFNFDYGYVNSSLTAYTAKQYPIATTAIGGTAIGVSTLAARKAPRITAAGAIGLGISNLVDDMEQRKYLVAPRARFQNSIEIGSDVATTGGGVMALARKNRRAGFAIAAAGLASRFASEFIPTELKLNSITRKDGSDRPPFDSNVLGTK